MPRRARYRRRSTDVLVASLDPTTKRQLWRGMQALSPQKAAAWQALHESEQVQALQQHFGAGFFLTRRHFDAYMAAGANTTITEEQGSAKS